MNFPAIAKQTYELLKAQSAFISISEFVTDHLKRLSSPLDRARFVHSVVDNYNLEVFNHPIVKELSPCKKGCSACCHTQVSVTDEEAELLVAKVKEGIKIDHSLLKKQMAAGNCCEEFYKLSYQERRCLFLGKDEACQVYDDRPSVCRTNAVLGDNSQCSSLNGYPHQREMRLVKTAKADMAIMASFINSSESGTLALMIGKKITQAKFGPFKKLKNSFSYSGNYSINGQ